MLRFLKKKKSAQASLAELFQNSLEDFLKELQEDFLNKKPGGFSRESMEDYFKFTEGFFKEYFY